MCDIVFKKTKDHGGAVKRTSKAALEGFFKKGVMRNFPEFKRKICTGITFFDKLNSEDLQLH